KDGWGSFPKSWVDFNVQTGQTQYWYTSGGAADPRKKPTEITVEYTAEEPEPQVDEETIKNTTKSTPSVSDEGLTVNVTGEGYGVLPKASTGRDANGVYVAVVDRKVKNSEIELSRPSAKAASAAMSSKEPVAVEYVPADKIKDGKLDAKVTAGADKLNKDTDYDTVVWVAHGNPNDETVLHRSNINLTDEQKNTLFPAEDPKEQETQDPKDPETQDPQEPTEPEAPDTKEPETPETQKPNEPGTPENGNDEATEPGTKEPEAPDTPENGDDKPTDPETQDPKEPEVPDTKEPEVPEAQEPNEPGTPENGNGEPTEPGTKEPEVKEPEVIQPEAQGPEGQNPGAEVPGADRPGAAETSGSHGSSGKPSPTASKSLPRTGGTNLAVGIAGITLLAVGAVAMIISSRRA
ncbi:cell surface protein, partial [Brevibacterium sp. UMB10442]|nr:cell surface protein [Brevibacterium sp. UMB10442]